MKNIGSKIVVALNLAVAGLSYLSGDPFWITFLFVPMALLLSGMLYLNNREKRREA